MVYEKGYRFQRTFTEIENKLQELESKKDSYSKGFLDGLNWVLDDLNTIYYDQGKITPKEFANRYNLPLEKLEFLKIIYLSRGYPCLYEAQCYERTLLFFIFENPDQRIVDCYTQLLKTYILNDIDPTNHFRFIDLSGKLYLHIYPELIIESKKKEL